VKKKKKMEVQKCNLCGVKWKIKILRVQEEEALMEKELPWKFGLLHVILKLSFEQNITGVACYIHDLIQYKVI